MSGFPLLLEYERTNRRHRKIDAIDPISDIDLRDVRMTVQSK